MNKEQTSLLVHGYGFNDHNKNKPDFRGRLTMLAAAELKRGGKVERLYITGGVQQLGEGAIAEPMLKQIENTLRTRSGVFFSPVPGGTVGEISEFRRLTDYSKGMKEIKLAILATDTHLPRIKCRLKNKFGRRAKCIEVFSVEKVLREGASNRSNSKNRYQALVYKLQDSEDEKLFKRQERIIRAVEIIPFGNKLIDFASNSQMRFEMRERIAKVFRKDS